MQKLSSRLSAILFRCPRGDFSNAILRDAFLLRTDPQSPLSSALCVSHEERAPQTESQLSAAAPDLSLEDDRLLREDWVAPGCPVGDFPHGRDKSILQNGGRGVTWSRSSTLGRSS